jgi:hypothetical protein
MSERGGSGGFTSGMKICTPAMEELDRVLHGVIGLCSWVKIGVGLGWYRDEKWIHAK